MKTFMSVNSYCKQARFPIRSMRELVHSNLGEEFCHRSSGARNATILIDVQKFERMWESGEFAEILER